VRVVLDSSALIAFVEREPGGEVVARHLAQSALSSVNYSETIARLVAKGTPVDRAARIVEVLDLDIVDFDAKQALETAAMLPRTKDRGLSLGDRACLTLGLKLNLSVLTADRAWAGLLLGVKIDLIR